MSGLASLLQATGKVMARAQRVNQILASLEEKELRDMFIRHESVLTTQPFSVVTLVHL